MAQRARHRALAEENDEVSGQTHPQDALSRNFVDNPNWFVFDLPETEHSRGAGGSSCPLSLVGLCFIQTERRGCSPFLSSGRKQWRPLLYTEPEGRLWGREGMRTRATGDRWLPLDISLSGRSQSAADRRDWAACLQKESVS